MITKASLLVLSFIFPLLFPALCQTYPISSKELQADFDTLCHALETIHADLYLHQTPEHYQQKKDSVRQLLKPMKPEDFYLITASFVASVGDGHSIMEMPTANRIEYLNQGGKTLPLRLRLSHGKLWVDFPIIKTEAINEKDEIIAINGIPSSDIVNRLYRLKGAERSDAIKDHGLTNNLSTLLWCIYNWEKDYEFEIKTDEGSKIVRLPGITQAQAFPVLKARLSTPVKQFFYTMEADKKTATLTIKNFFDLNGLTTFCDSVFPLLYKQKISGLTIDIRNNSGGNTQSIEKLMTYLSHNAYRVYARHDLKISQASKMYYKLRHPEEYEEIKDLPEGSIYSRYPDFLPANRNDSTVYTGKLTVLVNENTYSAASTFAAIVECSKAGTVVGQTGCPPVYFGNFITGKLPHSKLIYYISFKKFYDCNSDSEL